MWASRWTAATSVRNVVPAQVLVGFLTISRAVVQRTGRLFASQGWTQKWLVGNLLCSFTYLGIRARKARLGRCGRRGGRFFSSFATLKGESVAPLECTLPACTWQQTVVVGSRRFESIPGDLPGKRFVGVSATALHQVLEQLRKTASVQTKESPHAWPFSSFGRAHEFPPQNETTTPPTH